MMKITHFYQLLLLFTFVSVLLLLLPKNYANFTSVKYVETVYERLETKPSSVSISPVTNGVTMKTEAKKNVEVKNDQAAVAPTKMPKELLEKDQKIKMKENAPPNKKKKYLNVLGGLGPEVHYKFLVPGEVVANRFQNRLNRLNKKCSLQSMNSIKR